MSKTPNFDAKIKILLDATMPGERVCPISGESWTLTPEDIERYRAWGVPPPAYSPTIRMKELASWGAGVELWWKPHHITGKPILTGVHPDAIVPVVPDDEWYSKDWGIEHPLEADLSRSVFDQLEGLFRTVPYLANSTHGSTNVVGCGIVDCVNCYMIFGTKGTREAWYTVRNTDCEGVMDCVFLLRCQNTYLSAKSVACNQCTQVFECNNCLRSAFLFDCQNCEDCFCSSNLRRKQFMFMNEQLTKEEYQQRMREIDLSSTKQFEHWQQEFRRVVGEETIWPENFSVNVQDCAGEGMMDSLNCSGFLMDKAKDVRDGWCIFDSEHLETVVISFNSRDCYYTPVAISAQNTKFTFIADFSSDVEYCFNCRNIEHCFGCVGLNRKRFCIFNKQYSEEEYWKKLDEVKCAMFDRGEYGTFFPAAFSALGVKYGFNYLIAPFTDEEFKKIGGLDLDPIQGMRYAPYDVNAPTGDVTKVPDRIADVGEEWIGQQFFDQEANRRYAVNKQELAYRKDHGYPFPRRHYTARLKELVASCNGPLQEKASCAKCSKEIMTSSSTIYPTRTIYCKACYYQFLESR